MLHVTLGGMLMHEFSLVQSILERALALSRSHGGAPVERITIEIGALQAVVPEALEFAFDIAVKDTAAEGAVLDWREIKACIECTVCQEMYEPEDVIWNCPHCGVFGGRAIRGDELQITRVVLLDRDQLPA